MPAQAARVARREQRFLSGPEVDRLADALGPCSTFRQVAALSERLDVTYRDAKAGTDGDQTGTSGPGDVAELHGGAAR